VIAHISGTLAQKIPGEVVIDVAGVGYQIFIPLNVFYRLPEIGTPLSLQIYTHVREDALQLFGFQDLGDKQLFLLLLGVSGIGPKLAVNILSGIATDELSRALKEGDQVRLMAIPGVGRKLAERMIVELKDKFATLAPTGPESAKIEGGSQLLSDAVSALVNLGYKRPEAEKIVREVLGKGERSLEKVLKESLRRVSP
jgi:Holliday junction DNA helicase RuvA